MLTRALATASPARDAGRPGELVTASITGSTGHSLLGEPVSTPTVSSPA